jgi:hypothetical protein
VQVQVFVNVDASNEKLDAFGIETCNSHPLPKQV